MFSRSPPRPIENARTVDAVVTADSDRNFNEAILDVLGMAIGGNWGVPDSFDADKRIGKKAAISPITFLGDNTVQILCTPFQPFVWHA